MFMERMGEKTFHKIIIGDKRYEIKVMRRLALFQGELNYGKLFF